MGRLPKSIALSRFCVVVTKYGFEIERFRAFFDFRLEMVFVQRRPDFESIRLKTLLGFKASVSITVFWTASSWVGFEVLALDWVGPSRGAPVVIE